MKRLLPHSILILLIAASPVQASWNGNGNVVCGAPGSQQVPQIVSDSDWGTIVVWLDKRVDGQLGWDIFAQRLFASGEQQWSSLGVPVTTANDNQSGFQCISDGAGSAIVAWTDSRAGAAATRVYAQRIGSAHWATNGIPVTTAQSFQGGPVLVADGAGGAFIVWLEGIGYDVHGQRVSAAGDLLWGPSGVTICAASNPQGSPQVVPDGSGGVIVAWIDRRNSARGVYAQRLDAGGAAHWQVDGALIAAPVMDGDNLNLVSDGSGGAIAAWLLNNSDLFVQRLDGAGMPQWGSAGIAVSSVPFGESTCSLLSDPSGGAIVAWRDVRNGINNSDVYAQRFDSSGAPRWASNGVVVCQADSMQAAVRIASDGADGAFVVWRDLRNGDSDVFAQRLDPDGNSLWPSSGIPVSLGPGYQDDPTIVSNGDGTATVAWSDSRNGTTDIYATRVGADGAPTTGVRETPPAFGSLASAVPNPFSQSTSLNLALPDRAQVDITVFDVAGRVVHRSRLGILDGGLHRMVFNGTAATGRALPSGVYFYRATANGHAFTQKIVLAR